MSEASAAAAIDLGHSIEIDLRLEQKSIVRHLCADALQRARRAREMLVDANPEDPREIRTLQNEAKRLEEIVLWVRERLSDADNAYASLDPDEREEIDFYLTGQTEVNDA